MPYLPDPRQKKENMKNFYTEHKGYNKLKSKLIRSSDPNLADELLEVVGEAIQYGIGKLSEEVKGEKRA